MLKQATKFIFLAKAALDILKEKTESKATDLLVQARSFGQNMPLGKPKQPDLSEKLKSSEKTKQNISDLVTEIHHKAQINELQLKGFIKDKLVELTSSAILDSSELNDIRAEIASLHAEISDLKSLMKVTKK